MNTALKALWLTIISATVLLLLLQLSGVVHMAWYWLLSPVWIPWSIIIVLGQYQLVRTYVKNQYWK